MKHYGDITKIDGYSVPLVDIVCGGSPCQDLSVAGARKGLAGERSGLFMEQIRVIKEIRNAAKQLSMRGTNEPIRPRFMVWENVTGALTSGTPKGEDFRIVLEETAKVVEPDAGSVVRRLTPLECERLQGFPDGWTDIGEWVDTKGKKHKDADSPRYKALGNSIALPFWDWMAQRMVSVLREEGISDPKMASLFDGIGGFPLVFSHHGCTPVWASEIEEFPIAVTKRRFPDGE